MLCHHVKDIQKFTRAIGLLTHMPLVAFCYYVCSEALPEGDGPAGGHGQAAGDAAVRRTGHKGHNLFLISTIKESKKRPCI